MYRLKKFVTNRRIDEKQRALLINGLVQSYHIKELSITYITKICHTFDEANVMSYHWRSDGTLQSIFYYGNGRLRKYYGWHENGAKKYIYRYRDKQPVKYRCWNINGKLIASSNKH